MGLRADGSGVQYRRSAAPARAIDRVDGVQMRTVERGHPLFGPACDLIRAEALIRIDCEPPLPMRPARARPARRAKPRRAPRLGIADVPWAQPCGYDPQWLIHPAALTTIRRAALAARWDVHLQHDRRRSAHTVRAYVATAHRLIEFLGRYRGEAIDAAALRTSTPPTCAPSSPSAAPRARHCLGGARAFGVRAFLTFAAEQQGAPRSCRAPARRSGRARCRGRPRPTRRWSLPRMRRKLRARRGSAPATSRSCCCSTAPACASPRRCR